MQEKNRKQVSQAGRSALKNVNTADLDLMGDMNRFGLKTMKFFEVVRDRMLHVMEHFERERSFSYFLKGVLVFYICVLPFALLIPPSVADQLISQPTIFKAVFGFASATYLVGAICLALRLRTWLKWLFCVAVAILAILDPFYASDEFWYRLIGLRLGDQEQFVASNYTQVGVVYFIALMGITYPVFYSIFWILKKKFGLPKLIKDKIQSEFNTELRAALLDWRIANESSLQQLIKHPIFGDDPVSQVLKYPDAADMTVREDLVAPQSVDLSASGFKIPVYLGVDSMNNTMSVDLTNTHVGIAGSTNSGKSNLMNLIVGQLLKLDNLRLVIADPHSQFRLAKKRIKAEDYVRSKDAIVSKIKEMCDEMERRIEMCDEEDVMDIDELESKGVKLGRIVLLLDEFAALKNQTATLSQIEKLVAESRKYGIHLVWATQHPKSKYVSTEMRGNTSVRIGLACNNRFQSEAILGSQSAVNLPRTKDGKSLGWAIFKIAKKETLFRVPLVSSSVQRNGSARLEEPAKKTEESGLDDEPKRGSFITLQQFMSEHGLTKDEAIEKLRGAGFKNGSKRVNGSVKWGWIGTY